MPQLTKYLKGLFSSLRIQTFKRPEFWVKWVGFVATMVAIRQLGFLVGLSIGLAFIVAEVILVMARHQTTSLKFALNDGLRPEGPNFVRLAVKYKRVEEELGSDMAQLLESMSANANRITEIATSFEPSGSHLFQPLRTESDQHMKSVLSVADKLVQERKRPAPQLVEELRLSQVKLEALRSDAEGLRIQLQTAR